MRVPLFVLAAVATNVYVVHAVGLRPGASIRALDDVHNPNDNAHVDGNVKYNLDPYDHFHKASGSKPLTARPEEHRISKVKARTDLKTSYKRSPYPSKREESSHTKNDERKTSEAHNKDAERKPWEVHNEIHVGKGDLERTAGFDGGKRSLRKPGRSGMHAPRYVKNADYSQDGTGQGPDAKPATPSLDPIKAEPAPSSAPSAASM